MKHAGSCNGSRTHAREEDKQRASTQVEYFKEMSEEELARLDSLQSSHSADSFVSRQTNELSFLLLLFLSFFWQYLKPTTTVLVYLYIYST